MKKWLTILLSFCFVILLWNNFAPAKVNLPYNLRTMLINELIGENHTWTGTQTFPGGILSSVSTYSTAASTVTLDLASCKTHYVELDGTNSTTGVSVNFTAPTFGAAEGRIWRVYFKQPAANSCEVVWTDANIWAPSGTSPALTNTAAAYDIVTIEYNATIGKYFLTGGGYDYK